MKNIIKIIILGCMVCSQAQANGENNIAYEQLLPQYVAWAKEIEKHGMLKGKPLNKQNLHLAREIGIKSPEKVRVIYVNEVPFPYSNLALKTMGKSLGLIGEGIINNAQVFGYSIYVRKSYTFDRPRLAHELVHVLQIERASFSEVLTQHISDLHKYSYEEAPLEVEAFKANKRYAID